MGNRSQWVNYTKFPAVNWFTHRSLASFMRQSGFETYEIFDLVREDLLSKKRRRFFFLFDLLRKHSLLRYLVYPVMGTVQILAVKRDSLASQAECRRATCCQVSD